MKTDTRWIWIDLEMTGLNTNTDHIIEIATIVTDDALNIIAEGPSLAIHQSDDTLDAMDDWNTRQHGGSGLTARVKASTISTSDAEVQTLEFLKQHVAAKTSPMCGNSICQDRRFLHREMPQLEAFFHYRHLDVSTIKILANAWLPALSDKHQKISQHTALQDIRDSIDELRFYKTHCFKHPLIDSSGA